MPEEEALELLKKAFHLSNHKLYYTGAETYFCLENWLTEPISSFENSNKTFYWKMSQFLWIFDPDEIQINLSETYIRLPHKFW